MKQEEGRARANARDLSHNILVPKCKALAHSI